MTDITSLDEHGKAWKVTMWHGTYWYKKNADTGQDAYEWMHRQGGHKKFNCTIGEFIAFGLITGDASVTVVDIEETPFPPDCTCGKTKKITSTDSGDRVYYCPECDVADD